MDTTISDDEFIETVVSSAKREVHELAEEHIIFPGPDPQVLIHIWHENGCYFSGISERSYNPRGAVRANDLTTIKQWLVMELFDFLRLSWQLEDIGIAFRWLSPAQTGRKIPRQENFLTRGHPQVSLRTSPHVPPRIFLGSSNTRPNGSSRSPTSKAPKKSARPCSACHASPSPSPTDRQE